MQDILTLSGRPVSRLGLAAGSDMDERCVQAAFEGGVTYFFFYNTSFTAMLNGLRSLLQRHREGAEEKVFPAALKAGVPVTAFTCTRWGSLLKRPPAWDPGRPVPAAADCYRFVLRHPAVRIALTAPATVRQLYDNLSVLRDGPDLSPEQYRAWEEYGRLVHGDGKGAFETRWP